MPGKITDQQPSAMMSMFSSIQDRFVASSRSQLKYLQARMESEDDFRERAARAE